MAIRFMDTCFVEGQLVAIKGLDLSQRELLTQNQKELIRLLDHLCCNYHPLEDTSIVISLREGMLLNVFYACCPSFQGILKTSLHKSSSPYTVRLMEQVSPAAQN